MEDEKNYLENFNHGKITQVDIAKEIRESFLDYSMSVIVSRALPDVRDGLKPVHRRILYAMYDNGITSDKPHKKSARIVGEVLGKYHPHGDTAVYDSMVRMAQPFSYRYPLIDGHGNFGSIDGDEAAAMRYTEARMSKIAFELLRDIQKETIDWQDNYDAEEKEPTVLPSKFPNLLVNGSTGIAVGMATNMPPHNLKEAIDATIAVMENPEISIDELMANYISGPDFPTGAYILGRSGIRQAYETGRGAIILRSKVEIEDMDNGKKQIIVKEIPYQVNKAVLVEKIASLVRDKQIEGISALRDESNREGIRIVIEIKKDAQVDVVLNQLYRLTSLQTSFGVNNVVLVKNKPMLLGLKDLIKFYIEHEIDVIIRRTKFDLRKAKERAHILEGLKIALDNIDAIVDTIKTSKDNAEALNRLMSNFGLDEVQAKAILDMQLRRLTGLERDKILDELHNLEITIADLEDILANHTRVLEIIKTELLEIKEKYGDERMSEIIEGDLDVEDEDLIPVKDVIISLSHKGYIKRLSSDTYRTQNRGGRGIKGMSLNEDDETKQNISMSTHDWLLIFSNKGKVYRLKGYRVPESSRSAKGLPIVNLVDFDKDEHVQTMVSLKVQNEDAKYAFFVTKNGIGKRVAIEEFANIRQSGKIAINLTEGDELIDVKVTHGNDDVIIGATNGKAVRFNENAVRAMGRNASGVKVINLDGASVVGAAISSEGKYILVVSHNGYGKMSALEDYRLTSRGAKGVKTINATAKTGELMTLKAVNGDEDCIIMTSNGIVIRISLNSVSTTGRGAQGVRLIKTGDECFVTTVTILDKEEEEEEEND